MLKLHLVNFYQQTTLEMLTFLCFQVCVCNKMALWAAKGETLDGERESFQQILRDILYY